MKHNQIISILEDPPESKWRSFRKWIRRLWYRSKRWWMIFWCAFRGKPYIGNFESYTFPIIHRVNYELAAQELISVQPMNLPTGLVFYMDYKCEKNPQLGQVFEAGLKNPLTHVHHGGCCRNSDDYWHKIFTEHGWVYEKQLTPEEWEIKVDKYKFLDIQ